MSNRDSLSSATAMIAKISPRNFEFIASFATALPGPITVGVNYKLITLQVDCSGDCTGRGRRVRSCTLT